MTIHEFSQELTERIDRFESSAASGIHLADGTGESHVYCVYFGSNGIIGQHPTGFCQLFLVVSGSGWVAGEDGIRKPIASGQFAYFNKGEDHSKGSDSGMTAIMVQSDQFTLGDANKKNDSI